jgi:hypothetical protein
MIKYIPNSQLCQVFDPMVILPEKTEYILDSHMKVNTSCVAPAYVYIEGSRGKRFLCDYHYYFEKDIVMHRTPDQWPLIEQYVIEKLEDIKLTFGNNKTNLLKDYDLCWCKKIATTMSQNKISGVKLYHCNFHFRKIYFRYLSNGVQFDDQFHTIDERYKMQISIKEEMEQLTRI